MAGIEITWKFLIIELLYSKTASNRMPLPQSCEMEIIMKVFMA
jgi:hypothetical protein